MSTDFDLAENVFYFHNFETKSLAFVLNWDTREKFYLNLLTVSHVIVVLTYIQSLHVQFCAPVRNICESPIQNYQ